MKSPQLSLSRSFSLAIVVLSIAAQIVLPFQYANAAQITDRSLTLEAGATDGGSKPGGIVNHYYTFTLPGGGNVGSIKFQYCLTAADTGANTCVAPAGLDTSTSTLGFENGVTGFTNVSHPATNELYISKATAAPVAANTIVNYRLTGITNPTTPNQTFFVRITTFETTDATGTATDAGVVTAATAEQIVLDGIMPESLVFCTGGTVGLDVATSTVPDCATATSGVISFDKLFSPTDTATATSQMAASTNAGDGYAITVNGTTLTSGSNTIGAMGTTGFGVRGTSQFGMNLKANTNLTSSDINGDPVGIEVAPAPNAVNYRGQASPGYDTVDQFKFATGDVVADSYNGGAGGTDAQIFTVSYIANVPGSQPAGTYSTTLTYICTPTF